MHGRSQREASWLQACGPRKEEWEGYLGLFFKLRAPLPAAARLIPSSKPLQDTFIFRVEGTGVLPPDDIILTALDVLSAKLATVSAEIDREAAELGNLGLL